MISRNFLNLLMATSSIASFGVMAQSAVPVESEFDRRIQHLSFVDSIQNQFIGEQVSLSNGSLEIVQIDIDLPGSSAIPVRIGRRFVPGNIHQTNFFEGWDLEIPHIHGSFPFMPSVGGWTVSRSGDDKFKRCSLFGPPGVVAYQGGTWNPDEYWNGNFFYRPGRGDEELLGATPGTSHVPTDGHAYPIVTLAGSAARCIPLASTSMAGSQGEAFEVVSSDGLIYTMNHMVTRPISALSKANPAPSLRMTGQGGSRQTDGGVVPMVANSYVLGRDEVILYPSRVRDQFGNYVDYQWSAANPWQLVSISSNDGRHLTISYPDAASKFVSSISDGSRVWSYLSSDGKPGQPVIFPDGSRSSASFDDLQRARPLPMSTSCDHIDYLPVNYVGTFTGPSGVTVELTLQNVLFGRSWVERECFKSVEFESIRESYLYLSAALVKKKVTGPGLPAAGMVWTYDYGSPNNCWNPGSYGAGSNACTATSATTRIVKKTDPDGTVTRYTYGNRFNVDEGLLLKTDYGWNGASALRSEEVTYADPEAAPYRAYNGISYRNVGDYSTTGFYRPRARLVTTEAGKSYRWEVATDCGTGPRCFDTQARPTKIIRSDGP